MGLFEDMATILNGGTADKSKLKRIEKRREYFERMGWSGSDKS